MAAPSVRRYTSWRSDSLCFPNARHSISTCQSRCIFRTLPSQHNAFHPFGRDVLDGQPLVST